MPLARLKPKNKKLGHLVTNFTVRGNKFDADRGWYQVDAPMAAYLRSITEDPEHPAHFDVAENEEEANAITAARRKRVEPPPSGTTSQPVVTSGGSFSTDDLKGRGIDEGGDESESDGDEEPEAESDSKADKKKVKKKTGRAKPKD